MFIGSGVFFARSSGKGFIDSFMDGDKTKAKNFTTGVKLTSVGMLLFILSIYLKRF